MPDGTTLSALAPPLSPQQKRFRARWVSPLLRRILLVNALPLALAGGGAAVSRPVPERPAGSAGRRRCVSRRGSSPARWARARCASTDRTIRSWCRKSLARCCAG